MKKKNKGFTLIELLAVIVILGIILTIVVSNVVKYIGKAREGAFKDTYAKVLKDVSNKIALNDLGDTEEVACKNPTECAAAYDVPAENIALLVRKLSDDKYSVSMKGIGSYSSIALTSTSKPNNAGLIDGQTISSTIDSDGEVKANDAKNAGFFTALTDSNSGSKKVTDAAPLKIVSYITYEDNNGSSETKFYGMDGKEVNIIIKQESIDDFKEVLKEFNAFISTCSLNRCKNYEEENASNGSLNRYTVENIGSIKYQTLRPKNEYLGENSGKSYCGSNCTWQNNKGWRIQYQEPIS